MDNTTTSIKHISVNDGYKFRRIADVMNCCFGKHYKGCQRSFMYVDESQKYTVWFPKMTIKKNGVYKAPANAKGWRNVLSDDGGIIIEEKENDSRSGTADGKGGLPRYTFGYFPKEGYVFLGIFQVDRDRTRKGHWEFRRAAAEADLCRYHGKHGFDMPDAVSLKINEQADSDLITELRNGGLDGFAEDFAYSGKPRKVRAFTMRDGVKIYPRDRQAAANALAKAHFLCEADKDHLSFIRKNSDKPYTEPHHLIPLAFQDRFEVSLDVEENIVSLCSNCHNEIHYGADADKLIEKLFAERCSDLKRAGIDIFLQDVLAMYGYDR